MIFYHSNSLPNSIAVQLKDNGTLDDEMLEQALKALTKGKNSKRALLYLLNMNPEQWDKSHYDDTANGLKGQRKRLRQFLSEKNLEFCASDISRSLDACSVESALGLDIGSQKESVLRPLAPLLKRGKQAHLKDAWNQALDLARNKPVITKHVEQVMASDEFQTLTTKKTKKQLPIGNKKEDRKTLRGELKSIVRKLKSAQDIHALVKRATQLHTKQKNQQSLNKQ